MVPLTECGDGPELALHLSNLAGCISYLLWFPLTECGDGPELALHLSTKAGGIVYGPQSL